MACGKSSLHLLASLTMWLDKASTIIVLRVLKWKDEPVWRGLIL